MKEAISLKKDESWAMGSDSTEEIKNMYVEEQSMLFQAA